MTRLPGALFVVDIMREHIAIKEAQKLNIPIFAMVDTNSDPREVDYLIPANDDASKSVDKILSIVTSAIADGLNERKAERVEKEAKAEKTEAPAETKVEAKTEAVAEPEVKAEAIVEEKAQPEVKAEQEVKVEAKKEAKPVAKKAEKAPVAAQEEE
jgi:small subunit ribosomal protein S2